MDITLVLLISIDMPTSEGYAAGYEVHWSGCSSIIFIFGGEGIDHMPAR
jgi:hypothetical protein